MIAEEVALATRLELGLAHRGEVSDLVDRRIAERPRVDGVLLELATPLDLSVDDVASRLDRLASVSAERAALMRVVVVHGLVASRVVSLERAVDYLAVRVAGALPSPLAGECGGLDDGIWLAKSGTYGTLDDVYERLDDLAKEATSLLQLS